MNKDKLQFKFHPDAFIKEVAIMCHELLCHKNHTDGCGWYYEIDNGLHEWVLRMHNEWYEKVEKVYIPRMKKRGISLEKLKTSIKALDYVEKVRGQLFLLEDENEENDYKFTGTNY